MKKRKTNVGRKPVKGKRQPKVRNRHYLIVGLIVATCVGAALVLCTVSSGRNSSAIAAQIKENAFKASKEIKSYHVKVKVVRPCDIYENESGEITKVKNGTVIEDEIWVKNPNLYKVTNKLTNAEDTFNSTLIVNGHTQTSICGSDINIRYNCTPFDTPLYSFSSSYDLVNELNALVQKDKITVLGSEKKGDKDVYKVERKRSDKELENSSGDSPDREVIWVDQTNSVCLKKKNTVKASWYATWK